VINLAGGVDAWARAPRGRIVVASLAL